MTCTLKHACAHCEEWRERVSAQVCKGIVVRSLMCPIQASDPSNQEAPALQIPKSYETGIINAFKQAIPEYISNALAAGR